jgi:3-dehydroquinate dehydratase type I
MMICIPVAAATQAEALLAIRQAAELADILELRMDLISGGSVKELISAVREAPRSVKILVTNRFDNPSDSPNEVERIGVLFDAVRLGADFVDVELKTAPDLREKLLSFIRENGGRTKLIVSEHDFQRTPSLKKLTGLFDEAINAGADIVKIVAFARSVEDNLRIFALISHARKRNANIVAFCMGEHGRISRVMAPLLGAYFTFASLKRGAESASGQLTVHEMKQIYRILDREGAS